MMQAQKGWPFPFPALADITISPDVRFARQKRSSVVDAAVAAGIGVVEKAILGISGQLSNSVRGFILNGGRASMSSKQSDGVHIGDKP
jgi:hypothetical protein